MSKLIKGLKITLAMTFVVLLVGTLQLASAQEVHGVSGNRPPSFADAEPAIPDAVAKGHVLEKTYLHSGNYSSSVSASAFTPIDSKTTISCPKGPCTIFAHMLVENGSVSYPGNLCAIVLYVDGSPADGNFFVGEVPSDGGYANATQDTQLNNLGTGNHTVQMFYFSEYGAYIGHYAASYALYEP